MKRHWKPEFTGSRCGSRFFGGREKEKGQLPAKKCKAVDEKEQENDEIGKDLQKKVKKRPLKTS